MPCHAGAGPNSRSNQESRSYGSHDPTTTWPRRSHDPTTTWCRSHDITTAQYRSHDTTTAQYRRSHDATTTWCRSHDPTTTQCRRSHDLTITGCWRAHDPTLVQQPRSGDPAHSKSTGKQPCWHFCGFTVGSGAAGVAGGLTHCVAAKAAHAWPRLSPGLHPSEHPHGALWTGVRGHLSTSRADGRSTCRSPIWATPTCPSSFVLTQPSSAECHLRSCPSLPAKPAPPLLWGV